MRAVIVESTGSRVQAFLTCEDGAVTIDWVVLTAIIVALAAAALSGVEGGVASLTARLAEYLQSLIV